MIYAKLVVTNKSKAPKTNTDICKTDVHKEPDYAEADNFTPNIVSGESNNRI